MTKSNQELENVVNDYLNNVLLSVDNLPTDVLSSQNEYLERIFRKKFRKYTTTQEVKDFVSDKLKNIFEKSLPMTFVPSFGGYKHWWTPSYPTTDWAEVFSMKFMLEFLAPIFNSYKANSVNIVYESEEVILSELNNVSQKGLNEYTFGFRELSKYFNSKLKEKTQISLVLAREQYKEKKSSKQDLLRRIKEVWKDYEDRFNSYADDDKERRIRKVETNFNFFKVDENANTIHSCEEYLNWVFSNQANKTPNRFEVDKDEKQKILVASRILNEAFLDVDYEIRGTEFFDDESTIPLLFSFGLGPGGEAWPHVGSCESSMVDFWAGLGILEIRDDGKIIPRILSRSQYEQIKSNLTLVSVKTDLPLSNKNYSSIPVYLGKLNF